MPVEQPRFGTGAERLNVRTADRRAFVAHCRSAMRSTDASCQFCGGVVGHSPWVGDGNRCAAMKIAIDVTHHGQIPSMLAKAWREFGFGLFEQLSQQALLRIRISSSHFVTSAYDSLCHICGSCKCHNVTLEGNRIRFVEVVNRGIRSGATVADW